MEQAPTFKQAIAELARLQSELADVSGSGDPDWRHALLRLRRQLQSQISLLAQLAGDSSLASEQPELAHQFREIFSKMRATLALHQADWPAVQIDRADAGYQQSVKKLREANQNFRAKAEEVAPYVNIRRRHG